MSEAEGAEDDRKISAHVTLLGAVRGGKYPHGGKPIVNRRRSLKEIPPRSAESDAMSLELRRRGFRFVGSTICYAFMQAAGMVNDHLVGCFRYRELAAAE